jgi:hypothetical protein
VAAGSHTLRFDVTNLTGDNSTFIDAITIDRVG